MCAARPGERWISTFQFAYDIRRTISLLRKPLAPATCRLGAIDVYALRLGHRSRAYICAHLSHFGTHSGCPLCYEMPRSSLNSCNIRTELK